MDGPGGAESPASHRDGGSHAGYALVLLGESSCSAAIDGGPELTPVQVLTEAESRFTKAITAAQAANNTDILNMARVGRARARVDLKKFADAKTDASLVPDNYVHNATYSQAIARRENLINTTFFRGLFSSVDPSFRNLRWVASRIHEYRWSTRV
jgi:hypothetical protein